MKSALTTEEYSMLAFLAGAPQVLLDDPRVDDTVAGLERPLAREVAQKVLACRRRGGTIQECADLLRHSRRADAIALGLLEYAGLA